MPSSTIGAVGPEVNAIDASALKSLEAINHRLEDGGITLHLSEVKGPIMDRLKRSRLLEELTGKIHPTRYDAVSTIKLDLAREALAAGRASQAPLSGKESRS
jgi:sulfate permease, SulP family